MKLADGLATNRMERGNNWFHRILYEKKGLPIYQ